MRVLQVLFVAGRWRGTIRLATGETAAAFDLIGIFEDAKSAAEVCLSEHDFVGPVPVGLEMPLEVTTWPGLVYPKARREQIA